MTPTESATSTCSASISAPRQLFVFDVGGSHVSASLATVTAHAPHIETPNQEKAPGITFAPPVEASLSPGITPQAFVSLLADLAGRFALPASAASIAIPGPFDYERGISLMQHKLPSLYGHDLKSALAEALEVSPAAVLFLNDAAAYALGEAAGGAASNLPHDQDRAVVITLGTGIGSGFLAHSRIATSGEGLPAGGEIWNFPYRGGILEDAISTIALQRTYKQLSGHQKEVIDIALSADNREPAAIEAFTTFGNELGIALAAAVAPYRPNRIVLGGGISRAAHLFLSQAQSHLPEIKLVTATLMEGAPLAGAALHWSNSL